MSRLGMFGVVCVLVGVFTGARVASAVSCDTSPFSGWGGCGSICSESGGEVTCTGSSTEANVFILFEDDGDAMIYGTVDADDSRFCCDNADLGSITGAVPVSITTGSAQDLICLTDSNISPCWNIVANTQVWAEAADIESGTQDDIIVTCPSGEYDDVVNAGAGNDTISTFDGGDTIEGMGGDDTINSGDGGDTVTGGYDADTIFAGAGDDIVSGEGGVDTIWGQSGDDIISGGDDVDWLDGGGDADHLIGGMNTDDLIGGVGADCLCSGVAGLNVNDDGWEDHLDGSSPGTYDDCYYNDSEGDTATNCGGANTDDEAQTCGCDSP